MPKWLDIVVEALPIFTDWLRWVFESKDEEFESISTAWPAPIKTRLARLRYEAKKAEKFGDES